MLPASLGADRISLTADRFVAWTQGYQEGIPLQHGYGHPRLVKSAASPVPDYVAQLASLDAAARARGGRFGTLPLDTRRALLDEALTAAKVTQLPSRPTGGHVVSDLMAFYFRSSEANDVAHRARIGRQVCRPIELTTRRPTSDQPSLSPKPQGFLCPFTKATSASSAAASPRRCSRGSLPTFALAPPSPSSRRAARSSTSRIAACTAIARSSYGEHPWRDDYIEDQKAEGIISMTMAVGGLALHWGGACNRFSEEDLRLKSMYGLATDWPVAWDELERYYVEAERALNVAGEPSPYPEDRRSGPYPQPAVPLSYNLQVLKTWAEQSGLKFNALPMARNLTPADGRGSCCVFDTCGDVCPSGARYSPDFTFRQLIERKQIVLHDRTLIRKLTLDEARPVVAAATGVHQNRPGETEEYRARLFVLASGYCWSPHLLLLSANSRFPDGLANRSGLVGRYMTGHPFIEARATIDDQTFPGQHMVHSLISREHFRCATDQPFVRHDTRVWESSSGREPRLRSAEGRLLLGDEVFEDWRSRTRGQFRPPARLSGHASVGRQPPDARCRPQEPLWRSDAVDRAPLRRGDDGPAGGVEAARAGPVQPDGAGEQRQDRQHQRG